MKTSSNILYNKWEMLKIAYQFTAEVMPNYLQDKKAEEIQQAIVKNNLDIHDNYFLGDYTSNNILNSYNSFCDFGNSNKRYILLTNHLNIGLVCTVALNSGKVSVAMSDKDDYLHSDDFIVGINYIAENKLEIYNTLTAINKLYDKAYLQLHLAYGLPKSNQEQQLRIVTNSETEVVLYNKDREIVYLNIMDKINSKRIHKNKINKPGINLIGVRYIMDEPLYVEYNKILFKLTAVEQYWIKTDKL